LFATQKPLESLVRTIPKNHLTSLLTEYFSPDELVEILPRKVPRGELTNRLTEWVPPYEILSAITKEPREISPARKSKKKEIQEKYHNALAETDPNRKGDQLEEVVKDLIFLVDGLEVVGSNVDNGIQEIDVQVRNRNEENVWETVFDPMVFIECKNWSNSVKSKDVRDFEGKLRNSGLRAGILVSVNGLSGNGLQGAWGAVKEALQGGHKIIVLDGKDLEEIFACRDFSQKIGPVQ